VRGARARDHAEGIERVEQLPLLLSRPRDVAARLFIVKADRAPGLDPAMKALHQHMQLLVLSHAAHRDVAARGYRRKSRRIANTTI